MSLLGNGLTFFLKTLQGVHFLAVFSDSAFFLRYLGANGRYVAAEF